MIVAPSFLTADFTKLEEEIKSIATSPWLHFDVMDGVFVANKTYDETMIKQVSKWSTQVFDVHLMVVEPELVFQAYADAGADLITFHFEAVKCSVFDAITALKHLGVRVGISVKPNTMIQLLEPFLPYIDLVLVMSVEPGKGGQSFLPQAIDKIKWLDEKRIELHLQYLIEVDGGINIQTGKLAKQAGADVLVAGSYIFNQEDRHQAITALEYV